ncbi:MAG: glycosyltransferase [Thermodesulfobacteriota bacterium]|nr:glycosyltransferase [Thermodesulfobacteriota bacterium]
MDKPTFSIVIPTYNTTDDLKQCIQSLYNQSVDTESFEVLVINDGGKRDFFKNLDLPNNGFPIRVFSQDHKGPAAARNLGINNAKGKIILLLDDDSLPTKNWLNAVTKSWAEFPDFDGIGGYILSNPTDSIYCRVNSDLFNWFLDQNSIDGNCTFLVSCNAGYKKAILDKVGGFREHFKRASGEERDLNIRISKIGGRLRLDKEILVYHDKILSFRSFVKKHYNYGRAAYSIYAQYPKKKHLSKKSYINLYISILNKYRTIRSKIAVFSLITFSQIATMVGYYLTMFSIQNQKDPDS